MWRTELKYGVYLQYPADFPRISLFFLINTAPPASDNVYEQNFTAKKLQISLCAPPPCFAVILFCLFFFNHIVFTYWMVSICLYCCPFTPSRGVAINVFLAGIIIRLTNKNNVIVQIGYFTVFWKENIHGNKYVNQNIYIKKHEVYLIIWISYFMFFVLFC